MFELFNNKEWPASIDADRRHVLAALGAALMPMSGAWAQRSADAGPTIAFRGTPFVHRWSKAGQHEFTPADSADLASWRDMLTLNLHDSVVRGEQLADLANKVFDNYHRSGKVLQTRSIPRTIARPAEHLIVAVLGTPDLLEAAFARCLLHEGAGLVAVVSHRVYGKAAGPQMSDWLRGNGPPVEQALMAWAALPSVASLNRLPTGA
jgi:hypothetical protein